MANSPAPISQKYPCPSMQRNDFCGRDLSVSAMRPDPTCLSAFVDAQAALLGLQFTGEQRAGVLSHMRMAADMAALVMDFPLTPADESGNTFRPVEPGP